MAASQPISVDEAKAVVNRTRAEYERVREEVKPVVREALQRGLNDYVRELVIEQPEVISAHSSAELSRLKGVLGEAINQAVTNSETIIDEVGAEDERAALAPRLTASLAPAIDALLRLGFEEWISVKRLRLCNPAELAVSDLSTSSEIVSSETLLARAAVAYDDARKALRDAQRAVEAANALAVWDNA